MRAVAREKPVVLQGASSGRVELGADNWLYRPFCHEGQGRSLLLGQPGIEDGGYLRSHRRLCPCSLLPNLRWLDSVQLKRSCPLPFSPRTRIFENARPSARKQLRELEQLAQRCLSLLIPHVASGVCGSPEPGACKCRGSCGALRPGMQPCMRAGDRSSLQRFSDV
jgi:hypothetical protein